MGIMDILRFEMAMGPSHECSDCGHVFLANSDGCPNCGSYRIKCLHETEEEKWDMETFPIEVLKFEDLRWDTVSIGDFSPWPKV